jgi:hypothetical protein
MNHKKLKLILFSIITSLVFVYIELLIMQYGYVYDNGITINEFNSYPMICHTIFGGFITNYILVYFITRKVINYKLVSNIDENRYFIPFIFSREFLSYAKQEYFRIWKFIFLLITIVFLCYGSLILKMPDWDFGVSILMAVFSYLFSPLFISYLINFKKYYNINKIFMFITIMFLWLLTVDLSYMGYNILLNHMTFRYANFFASTILFILNGFALIYKGSFKEFLLDLKNINMIKTL